MSDYWGERIKGVPVSWFDDPETVTYPFGVQLPDELCRELGTCVPCWSPGAAADPTPLCEDPFPDLPDGGGNGNGNGGAGGSGMGMIVAAGAAVLILGLIGGKR